MKKIFPIWIIFFPVLISAAAFLRNDAVKSDEIGLYDQIWKSLFNMDVDLSHFDFYGNELCRPDLTLSKDHYLCIRTGNDSELFRRFAGLLEDNTGDNAITWDFSRVDQLKTKYYNLSDGFTGFSRVGLVENLVADLLLILVPSLQGTLLDYPADAAGILLLFFLKVDGHFDEFKEFYSLMKEFAFFELPGMSRGVFDSKVLIAELFEMAVSLNLPYTLELFYAMEMVDFDNNLLFKFVLETARCPVVINRFYDFIQWNKNIEKIPKIHFVLENYGSRLAMLFEYEAARIDWRAVDGNGMTFLGKLLTSTNQNAFSDHEKVQNPREILRDFLSHVTLRESASTFITSEKDVLMECYENEIEGLRLLAEYADNAKDMESVIEDYLQRIIEKWRESEEIKLVKVFKFLVKKTERSDSRTITPILNEAFEFFYKRLTRENSQKKSCESCNSAVSHNGRVSSTSRDKGSSSTSISNYIKSLLFVEIPVSQTANSPAVTPRTNFDLEMMKFIVGEAERIVEKENSVVKDAVYQWKIKIADY